MTKLLLITCGTQIAGFPNVLPLLALHMTAPEEGSYTVVDTGLDWSRLHQFVECERLSLTTPVSVAPSILREHVEKDILLFNANHFASDDVFRLVLLKHEANAELDRQSRKAIAFVPFSEHDSDNKEATYGTAFSLHQAGYEVRLVFSNLDRRDYYAPVRGVDMIHGSIPPLGGGLIELILREKRTIKSLLRNPPANFRKAIEHIEDWLTRCRMSKAFCDLAAPVMPPPVRLINGFPDLIVPRLHSYWTVETLADAADDPLNL